MDERLVKYKGRPALRQYVPLKPSKWGVEVWSMAESTADYVKICTGREGTQEKAFAHRVIMDLARPNYGSNLSSLAFYRTPLMVLTERDSQKKKY